MPNESQATMYTYTEKYPVPAFDAATVAALMPDQRQAAPYKLHVPSDRHSDDVAVQAPGPLAAPITSTGPAVPFSRLTHATPVEHWFGFGFTCEPGWSIRYNGPHAPVLVAPAIVTKPGWSFVGGGGHYLANVS